MSHDDDSGYREHAPRHGLLPYVACYWTRQSRGPGQTRVLPDGCVDLLFDLTRPSASIVVGTMTRPLVVTETGTGTHRWLGVRFRPGGSFPLLRFRLSEVTDSHFELAAVWSDAAEWAERIAAAGTLGGSLEVVEQGLTARLAQLGSPHPDPKIRRAVQRVGRTAGAVSIATLSGELGLSRQHLTRLFGQQLGVGVKRFSRIVRLQNALRLLQDASARGEAGGAALALSSGYCDQSHFVNDFKSLTGVTPSRYLDDLRGERR